MPRPSANVIAYSVTAMQCSLCEVSVHDLGYLAKDFPWAPKNDMSSKRRTRASGLPFLLINMAMTADGKIASANRAVSSFGSRRDREHLLELRATADAVMAGARTVDLNRINMGPGPEKYRRLRK